MTNRQSINPVLAGHKNDPILQHWTSFFIADTAKKLSPTDCHFEGMTFMVIELVSICLARANEVWIILLKAHFNLKRNA